MSFKDILDLEDEEIMEAFTPPKVSRRAEKIFNFLKQNQNLKTHFSGMSVIVTGLDRYKIVELAKVYNIDMSRYMFAIDMFENEMVTSFNRKNKKS